MKDGNRGLGIEPERSSEEISVSGEIYTVQPGGQSDMVGLVVAGPCTQVYFYCALFLLN